MARLHIGQGQVLLMAELFNRQAEGLPPCSQDELATMLKVDKATVTRAMAPLERVGYVVRNTDAEDRRIRRVQLTPKAMEIEAEFFGILYDWSDALLTDIQEPQRNELFSLLHVVLANADRMADTARTDGASGKAGFGEDACPCMP